MSTLVGPPAGTPASAVGTGTPAVEVRDLHVNIGGSHVLQGVELTVPAGGVTALLGRNGVGKTTTLRALLNLLASSGEITLLGRSVAGWPTHRIAQLGIGYVPENRDVFSGLTVAENLRLVEGADPRYDDVYALFPELAERSRQAAGTLSGGQQQMLSLARALLHERPLLLVDEPTKGLAPRLVSEVVGVLERAAAASTVLLVEQNIHVVRRLASRVVVLDHGCVVHTGPVSDLDDELLARRLLGVSVAP